MLEGNGPDPMWSVPGKVKLSQRRLGCIVGNAWLTVLIFKMYKRALSRYVVL